ncbi:MAG: hypothetical protein IIY57_05200 [Erysipelotrichaceae bacterium]|nr:hypothetical protein [Erysipelotrichaceae bacterium]
MAIYDNLPYTNFHELNADWLLKQMKEAKAKIDEYQEVLDQFEEDYNVLLGLASAMTVAGSNVTVAGSLTANGLIGNLTGNVTGDVTGNAATATYATSAGSATSATSATYATSAGSASTATNATNATNAVNATNAANATTADNAVTTLRQNLTTAITSTDADDYVPLYNGMQIYATPEMLTNVPPDGVNEEGLIITLKKDNFCLQIAWFYVSSLDLFYRVKYSASWQSWYKLTKASA